MRLVYLACLFVCLYAVPAMGQSFTVQWDHPADRQGGIGYRVFVGSQSGIADVTSFDAGNVTQALINVPSYATPYYVSIAQYDIAGAIGPKSSEVIANVPAPPPVPPPSVCVTNGVTYSAGSRVTFQVRLRDLSGWLDAREAEGWVYVESVPQNRNQWRVTVECRPR